MQRADVYLTESTDSGLELLLRGVHVDTVIIAGTTTENCCHATARDAMFRDFRVVFLADATATFDYGDVGLGGLSAEQVHQASLIILDQSTADVMTVDECLARVDRKSNSAIAARANEDSRRARGVSASTVGNDRDSDLREGLP